MTVYLDDGEVIVSRDDGTSTVVVRMGIEAAEFYASEFQELKKRREDLGMVYDAGTEALEKALWDATKKGEEPCM